MEHREFTAHYGNQKERRSTKLTSAWGPKIPSMDHLNSGLLGRPLGKIKIYQSSITKLILKRSTFVPQEGTFGPQILVAMLPGLRDYFCNILMSESPREMTAKEQDPIK